MASSEQDVILERLMEHGARAPREGRPWLALVVMVVVGAWMFYLTLYPIAALSVWDLQDPQQALSWTTGVVFRYALHALAFVTLGMVLPGMFLSPREASPRATKHRLIRSLGTWCGHGLLAVTVFVVLVALAVWLIATVAASGGLQLGLDAGIGLAALLVGAWVGFWWQRSRRGLLKQLVVMIAGFAIAVPWTLREVIQDHPFGFAVDRVSVKDKRDLMDGLQRESVTQEGHRVYRIAQDDLNKLLTWWISIASIDGKAKVFLGEGTSGQKLMASVRFPATGEPATYVNILARGNIEILDEQLEISFDTLAIGGIRLPGSVARWLGELAQEWVSSDRDNMELLTGIVRATINRDGVTVVVSDDGIRTRRIAKVLRQLGAHPDVTRRVAAHLTAFAEIARAAERKTPLFAPIVRNAFHRATEDSLSGNAVEANRAAMVALGIALGHHTLERVVGNCWEGDARTYVYRLPSHSRLRGRPDWARHFWVSAALTSIVGNRASDVAGLLKEELDSGDGGSGFSFADLMDDRAGTEFARAATRDERSARAIQAWVGDADNDLDQLMPPAADLPEGLSEAAMLEQYGGLKGKRYRQMIQQMEKRLQQVPWR